MLSSTPEANIPTGTGEDHTDAERALIATLSALGDSDSSTAEVFETGTHVEVFGRDMGDWVWVGCGEGIEESLHVYRHPRTGQWALLPVTDMAFYEALKPVVLITFNEMPVEWRRLFLKSVDTTLRVNDTYVGLLNRFATLLPLARSKPGLYARRQFRLRSLVVARFPPTETDAAEAMLTELAISGP